MINISIFRYLQNKHNSIINKMLTFLDKTFTKFANQFKREREFNSIDQFDFISISSLTNKSFQTKKQKRVYYPKDYLLYEVGVREC